MLSSVLILLEGDLGRKLPVSRLEILTPPKGKDRRFYHFQRPFQGFLSFFKSLFKGFLSFFKGIFISFQTGFATVVVVVFPRLVLLVFL